MTELRIKYVKWRNGRPRFEPGPRMRRIGIVGQDLKHDDGTWFSVEDAQAFIAAHFASVKEAEKSLAEHRVLRSPRGRRPKPPAGFVYFLWSGDHIKIGYSGDPIRRLSDIATNLPYGVRSLMCVPGTARDEKRIHHAMRAQRRSGEWFAATIPVLRLMQSVLARGFLELPTDDEPTIMPRKLTKSDLQQSDDVDFAS